MAIFKNSEYNFNETSERLNYFTIKSDKETKFVRFLYRSADDILGAVVHSNIPVNGRYRKINCIKAPGVSCPMCDAGLPVSRRYFLEMLEYEVVNGQFTGNKIYCVWERGSNFMKDLQSEINRYVPYNANLYDYLWEITRENGRTQMDVTYRIRKADDSYSNYCTITAEDIPENPLDIIGKRLVLSKTAQEMKTYVEVGEFPNSGNTNEPQQLNFMAQPQYQQQPQQRIQPPPFMGQQPIQQQQQPVAMNMAPRNNTVNIPGQVDDTNDVPWHTNQVENSTIPEPTQNNMMPPRRR